MRRNNLLGGLAVKRRRTLREQFCILHRRLLAIVRDDEVVPGNLVEFDLEAPCAAVRTLQGGGMMPAFARYIGIDYSGAETPTATQGLAGLHSRGR